MRIMESISSGQALFLSAITGLPSLTYAAIQEDFAPVATGAAVGFLAFLLTIWRSSNDSRFDALVKRLNASEKAVDEYRDEATKAKNEAAMLSVELTTINAQLGKLNDHA